MPGITFKPPKGIEPSTSPLPRVCSTTELGWHFFKTTGALKSPDELAPETGSPRHRARTMQVHQAATYQNQMKNRPKRDGFTQQCSGHMPCGKGLAGYQPTNQMAAASIGSGAASNGLNRAA